MSSVFIFTSKSLGLPSAVFTSYEKATDWIEDNYLSGILTEYPTDQSCYDWAIENGHFKEKSPIDRSPTFMEKFVSVYQHNWHFEHGKNLCSQKVQRSI